MQESTSYVLIEGDKMDESSVRNVQTPQIEDVRSKRAIMNKRRLWKFGVIPYEIDDDLGFDRITQIKAAMKHWEDVTCIIFVERDLIEHEDYIRFTEILECTCCSDVGKIGDRQVIGVTNCGGVGGIIHELGHVIGFHHEYQRPDRDEYIVIIEEEPTYEDIFSASLTSNCHHVCSIRLVNHSILTRLCMSILKDLLFGRRKGKMVLCRKWVETND